MANSEPLTGGGGTVEYIDADLDAVTKLETITDLVDADALEERLPGGWTVTANMVQFGDEDLEDTLLFRRGADDPQLVVKPADMTEPAGEIEFYERPHATASRELSVTAESLESALRAAINWVHQKDR